MSDNQQPAKNHVTLLLLSVMLLGAALVFAVAADAPHTLVLTAAGLGLSFSRRTPLSRTTRSYVYAGVSVLAATVLQDQIFPVDTQRFYLIDGRYYAPAVIFLGIAITFFEKLAYENKQYEWVFPMVVGPRYIPGAPASSSDESTGPSTRTEPSADGSAARSGQGGGTAAPTVRP